MNNNSNHQPNNRQYNQPQYNQSQYNQPQYNQSQYNQPQYGQPQYNQPQYGQSQYNQQPNNSGKKAKKKKKGLPGCLTALLVLIIIILLIILVPAIIFHAKSNAAKKEIQNNSGWDSFTEKEYREMLKTVDSDIDGMTCYDKYKMGLDVSNGSDSDFDGITDKDEIEIYGSDPTKDSTAGDLYKDGYKLQNGMDLFTYYDYSEPISFIYNECPEVTLEAAVPSDLNAVVKDITGFDDVDGFEVHKEYLVYNYSGNLGIDVSDVLTNNNLTTSDLVVMVSDGEDFKKYNFKDSGNTITLNKEMESFGEYNVFVAEKSAFGSANAGIRGIGAIKPVLNSSEDEIKGEALVFGSPILSAWFGLDFGIFYQDLGDDTESAALLQDAIDSTTDFIGEEFMYSSSERVSKKPYIELFAYKFALKGIVPEFEYLGEVELMPWYQYIICYYSYADVMQYQAERAEAMARNNEFDKEVDEFPFYNFGSTLSQGGNCAGLAHITSTLYNTGTIPATGNYTINGSPVTWDLTQDPENATLMNPGLSDYKYASFTYDHNVPVSKWNDDKILGNLTPGEQQFVNMAGCYTLEGNQRVPMIKYTELGGLGEYDYRIIEDAMAYIDQGRILDLYFRLDSGGGHTVNLYNYYVDPYDEDVIWFEVYDTNYPQDKRAGRVFRHEKCLLMVRKKVARSGYGYTFSYDYNPVVGGESRAHLKSIPVSASGTFPFAVNTFAIVDENWNVYNDRYKTSIFDSN